MIPNTVGNRTDLLDCWPYTRLCQNRNLIWPNISLSIFVFRCVQMSLWRLVRDSDTKTPVDASLAFALNTLRATSLPEHLKTIGAALIELSSCGVVGLFNRRRYTLIKLEDARSVTDIFMFITRDIVVQVSTPGNCFTPCNTRLSSKDSWS